MLLSAHRTYLKAQADVTNAKEKLQYATQTLVSEARKHHIYDADPEAPAFKRRIETTTAAEATTDQIYVLSSHPRDVWNSVTFDTGGVPLRVCTNAECSTCGSGTYYVCKWGRGVVLCWTCYTNGDVRIREAERVRPTVDVAELLERESKYDVYAKETVDQACARALDHEEWRFTHHRSPMYSRCLGCKEAAEVERQRRVLIGHPSVYLCNPCANKLSTKHYPSMANDHAIAEAIEAARAAP